MYELASVMFSYLDRLHDAVEGFDASICVHVLIENSNSRLQMNRFLFRVPIRPAKRGTQIATSVLCRERKCTFALYPRDITKFRMPL